MKPNIPVVNEDQRVAEAAAAHREAVAHRDDLRRQRSDLANRIDRLESADRAGTISGDDLESLPGLRNQLDQLDQHGLRVANRREAETREVLDRQREAVRDELRRSPAVQKAVQKARAAVAKRARALADAQSQALQLEKELLAAGIYQFVGVHSGTPAIGLDFAKGSLAGGQSLLLAQIAQIEQPAD